jgi:GT2 family glycosyltransferase
MSYNDRVSVTIVTYNSGRFIKRCLESVLAQKYPAKEIIVIDNASTDGTIDILEQFEDRCHIVYNDENIGFAAAQNQAIGLSNGEWVLTLNPDVLLLPNFIQALVDDGQIDRHGVRQAVDDPLELRSPRETAGGFHRDLFHPHAAAPGPRQPGG